RRARGRRAGCRPPRLTAGRRAGPRAGSGSVVGGVQEYRGPMEFRRITGLPPYVFTSIDGLKVDARRAGIDVIDLGFGNPDLPSPAIAVDKLCEAAQNTRNHRYSSSRGIPKLREAIAGHYKRRF